MKILQVYPYFYPAWSYGGVTRVVYEVSKHLIDIGHEVTVYTTDAFDNKSRVVIRSNPMYIDGIETFYFRNFSNHLTYKYHLPLPFEMFFKIQNKLKKFNIIHLHGYRHSLNVLTHHYAKKYDVPYVLKAGGSLPRITEHKGLKRLFDILFGYDLLRDAEKTIARNEREFEQYRIMGVNEDKIEILPVGINLTEYDNLPEKGAFRRKYLLGENEKLILYLGRIHRIKGLDLLVKAFAGLLKEFDNARLVIVGPDDGFLSTLKNLVQDLKIGDKVLFTGLLYERDKLEAYVDADVYVLPSMYETFPSTVLEAWACGTPVITTDRCGIADIVSKVGFVVKYDIEQIQNAIFEILSDDKLRKKFGAKGLKLVEEEFSWNTVIRKIETLYETVLTKNDRKCSTI